MDRSLYNYALLKALHDQGSDYIDCFWPFVISVLKADECFNVPTIQARLKEKLSAEVPLHVTESVIKRACDKGFLRQEKGARTFRLTKKGVDYRNLREKEKDVNRRLLSLAGAVVTFFEEKGQTISEGQVLDLVFSFVQQNRGLVIEFLNPINEGNGLKASKSAKASPESELLVAFIQEVDKARPEHYETLKDVLLGSLISAVVYTRDANQLDTLGHKKFRNCKVYLDTNIVLSVLELKEPDWNKAALELFALLRQFEFEVLVLPATVSEICHLVGAYRKAFFKYPKDMKVDSIYSNLRRKGWKESSAREFVINIEGTLRNKGISVDWRHDFDLRTYQLNDVGQRSLLAKYKPDQHELGQTHDLAAIETIQTIRERRRRSLEDCSAIFLTSDYRLSRFNFLESNHRADGTVCEVFLDKLFTNILWLKSPKLDLPLDAIIAVHSRDLFINHSVWDRFYVVVQQLHKEKKIDDAGISTLFYHNYIEGVLRAFDDDDLPKITPSFVLSHIQERANLIDARISTELRSKEAEFLASLDRDIQQTKAVTDEEWVARIESAKTKIRDGAMETARKLLLAARWLIAAVVSVSFVVLIYRHEWDGFAKGLACMDAIGIILGIAGLSGLGSSLQSALSDWIYRKRLRQSHLEKVAQR